MRGKWGRLAIVPVAGALFASVLAPSGMAAAATVHRMRHSTESAKHAGQRAQARPDESSPPDGSDLGDPLPLGDLADGTYVTKQFDQDGIVFSGQSPFITDDGASDVNPTLSGSPLFHGTVVGTFVKHGTNQPATVNDFSVEVGYIDDPGSTQMTVYNSKGKQIGVLVATQEGFNQLYSTFPDVASFSVSSVTGETAGWELNTIQIGPVNTSYIAMGDSYSSGEGTYDFPWSQAQGTQCDTGPLAWPVQLADDQNNSGTSATLNIDQDTLVACQGERTFQLGQAVNGESASELDQVTDWVKDHGPPDLLTITIGGNDLGFADILKSCFLGGTEICIKQVDSLDAKLTTGAASLIATLAGSYDQVVAAAKGSSDDDDGDGPQVAVVGYPNLFPQPGGLGTALSVTRHCPWLRVTVLPVVSPFVNILLRKISDAQAALNDDIAAAAGEAGVQFAPIPYSLSGHELCTATPYLNPLSLVKGLEGDRNIGHPNVAGSAAIANAVGGGLGLTGGSPNRPAAPHAHLRPTPAGHRASGPIRPGIRPHDTGPLSFSGGSLQDGTAGSDYIDYLVATGGNGTDTWSVTNGSLPPGLTLDANAGTITGTPTTPGDYTFTAQVTDSSDPPQTAGAQVTIDVAAATALSVAPGSPPGATAGRPYSFGLQAAGGLGQVSWRIFAGALPTGVHLNATTGQLYGTPATSAVGTASFTVRAADSSSPAQVATASESIIVHPTSDPLTVTPTTLPELTAGQDYGAQLTSTGGKGPVMWSVTAGSLPPGLSLDSARGLLSGTPTTAGTYTFTVRATDATAPVSQTVSVQKSITIDAPPPLGIATTGAFDGTEGSYYSSTFQATGGVGSYKWYISSGALPAGLSLNGSTGQVTGTPRGTGNSTFDVTVSDAGGDYATQSYSVDIAQVPLTVSSTLAPATVGTYYTGNVNPSGGSAPYGWSLVSGTLPDGLTFDQSTGAIVGTPTQSGSFPLQVSVEDSTSPAQQATANLTLTVAAEPTLTVSSRTPVRGAVGDFYTTGMGYSGGLGPYTWSVTSGSLPPGLTLDPVSGMVTGTPATSGSYPVTVQATDSGTPTPEVAAASLTFTIAQPIALTIDKPSLPVATQGVSYSASFQASGGVPHVEWRVIAGSLPAGLSLNSYYGAISGTPTGHGTSHFTIEAVDSAATPAAATRAITMTVNQGAPLSVNTTSLFDGTQGAFYGQELAASGGSGPYAWSLEAGHGTLPAGLTLQPSGYLEGTPTHFGTTTFTLEVTDSSTPTAAVAKQTVSLDLAAIPPEPPVFTADNPNSPTTLGSHYNSQFQASGNPRPTFKLTSGSLPGGLKLNEQGVVSGTTTHAGTFTFEVTASNGRTPAAVTPELHIQVLPPPVISAFTPTSGPPGTKVVITGKNLENAYFLYFDGDYATIGSDTYSKIVTSVPEDAGTGPISVYTLGGAVTSSTDFTVSPPPAPKIASFTPTGWPRHLALA
jgi:lysophospholipase L1-like esterase